MKIGLHFDPSIYSPIDHPQLQDKAKFEATMLESISGRPVKSISIHNPSVHGKYPEFFGFNNSYDKRFFPDARYFFDSRMHFRGKEPFTFTQKAKIRPLQILLHPIHFNKTETLFPDIHPNYLENYIDQIDDYYQKKIVMANN